MEDVIAIDPGNHKCGLAIVNNEKVLLKDIIETNLLKEKVKNILEKHEARKIILGDGTFSKKIKLEISDLIEDYNIELIIIDEKFSTEDARKLYFKENKPKGLWSFIPLSFQAPSEPIDDYAAIVLAKRYFKKD